MAKQASLVSVFFSINVLCLLMLCFSAESSRLVKVSPEILRWKDAKKGNCAASRTTESKSGFSLMHIKGKCSPFRVPDSTWSTSILNSIEGDARRYRAIMQRRVSVRANSMTAISTEEDTDQPVSSEEPGHAANYIIKLDFGTPGKSSYMFIDTGSDVAWIPCTTCSACQQSSGDEQLFDPSKSSTFRFLGCSSQTCRALDIPPTCGIRGDKNCTYTLFYGDNSEVDLLLSTDTITLGSNAVSDFVFGCATSLKKFDLPTPGLMGLGRGPLSFVSLTDRLYDRTFSYCLPSLRSSGFTGSLQLGKNALSAPGLQFTPLLTNAANPSFYYVGLNGISVGDKRVSIPAGTFDMDQSTGKGTIIDSGTVITRLVKPAYTAIRDSFRRQLSNMNVSMADSWEIFDTCYNVPSGGVEVPSVTLHFEQGLDWPLPTQNFQIPVDSQSSAACLAFALPPDDPTDSEVSIIGNYQQQNFRVVYDVPGSRLGIAAENCDG